jgi:Bacterial Ig-like domain (group 3)
VTTSSQNPSKAGQSVSFTTVVSPTVAGGVQLAGTPTGTVSFYDGGTLLGTAQAIGGKASLTTSGLKAGSHSIQAVYGGSGGYNPATGAVILQAVNP